MFRLIDFPPELSPPPTIEYVHKNRSLVFEATYPTIVHLDDYELMRESISNAPSYRLASRIGQQPQYPVPEPASGSLQAGSYSLPEKQLPTQPRRPTLKSRWHWLIPSIRKQFNDDYTRYDLKMLEFKEESKRVAEFNQWASELRRDRQAYLEWKNEKLKVAEAEAKNIWRQDKARWEANAIQELREFNEVTQRYESGVATDVERHFGMHVDSVPIPRWCPRTYEIEFDAGEGILVINFQLPHFGTLAIVKARDLKSGSKVVPVTQKEARTLSDQFPYLLALRVIWEVAQLDIANRVQLICLNGFVAYDDPATGRPRNDVVLSVAAKPQELRDIHLDKVTPEACFKSLKGVAGAQLSELVPIRPIITFDTNDKRFIKAEYVLDSVADTNLATMDWQTFEHLIRELFEKEFSSSGAEVKVTQASRDRGVDAVVFDPDPLRGGKLVIQAKRYVNTVDVSAVRDLYGTVMNEGANKGILVTTSNYGRDAYEFCKDKPLTLINGANLLHLLSKHGYQLNIDLVAAKRLLDEK